jgi:hypothetical protein
MKTNGSTKFRIFCFGLAVLFFLVKPIPLYADNNTNQACRGDTDCDGDVDGDDVATIAAGLGATGCSAGCGTGELQGTVSLCEPLDGAVGILEEVAGIALHTPGKNFFLKLGASGNFTMLYLPPGDHTLQAEKGDEVLESLQTTVQPGSVTNVNILLCPDRDGDGFDQSEDCDDSDSGIAEERSWHQDLDGDGFGNPENPVVSCVQPPDTVLDNTDCFDGNENAHPGQTAFFASDRGDGSFDYDCDGIQEQEYPVLGSCRTGSIGLCTGNPGWVDTESIPECGETESFLLGCSLAPPCSGSVFDRSQTCR